MINERQICTLIRKYANDAQNTLIYTLIPENIQVKDTLYWCD